MSKKFQVVTVSRNHVGAFPLEFYEDKALLFSNQHYALFKRTIGENPKRRGIIKVRNGKRGIYRSFMSEAAFHLNSKQIALDFSSLRELGLSRSGLREVEVSRGNRFLFYYRHPNSALRMPFKLGFYGIILTIITLIATIPSILNEIRNLLKSLGL